MGNGVKIEEGREVEIRSLLGADEGLIRVGVIKVIQRQKSRERKREREKERERERERERAV
jgi:hypothetical protein